MTSRRILRLSGPDTREFLQGLVTNDIRKLDQAPIYAAILTPQGKFITDFFLSADGDSVLLDVAEADADALVQRLTMYKLRADVTIDATGLHRDTPQTDDTTDWDALRVTYMIPETGAELTPDSFILEMGFERLNGVDFRKGCYVGQEVTARMKHKTELRKGLAQVEISAPVEPGTDITADGKPAGTIFTRTGTHALAYLRYDRAKSAMQAGDATVTIVTDGYGPATALRKY